MGSSEELTDKELAEFLREIESGDDELEDIEPSSGFTMPDPVWNDTPGEEDIEAYYGDNAWQMPREGHIFLHDEEKQRKSIEASVRAREEREAKLRGERMRIQRIAFSQDRVRLEDPMTRADMRLLIAELVREHTELAERYSSFINKRVAQLLSPLLPRALKISRSLYPMAFKKCPGFLYISADDLDFWVEPDVPCYFEQGTEMEVLRKHRRLHLPSLDKAVKLYHSHMTKKSEKEIKYATLLVRKKVVTYFDLLRAEPIWFGKFIDAKTRQDEEESIM